MVKPQAKDPNADQAPQVAGDTKFEAALAELEAIVQNMEGGNLSLEDSIAAYRRGSALLAHCQHQLNDAERKIQILDDGVLRDLDPLNGDAR